MLLQNTDISTDKIEDVLLIEKQLSLSILRLDKIHPVISGNKLFKLHFFLEEAKRCGHTTVVTFGGSYSNHLVASAYACKLAGLNIIGLVRGEEASQLSNTLANCIEYGMRLKFLSREDYKQKDTESFTHSIVKEFGKCLIIPEGGFHPCGARGAALIMDYIDDNVTHICTAAGTATTLAGLLLGAKKNQQVIGIPVLKGVEDIKARISFLTADEKITDQLILQNEYHFGGYAKKTPALISFMNQLYQRFHLPTDFVYTAKMMYGIFDLISQDYFPAGSNIVCVHTGGLQGNHSLPKGSLTFK